MTPFTTPTSLQVEHSVIFCFERAFDRVKGSWKEDRLQKSQIVLDNHPRNFGYLVQVPCDLVSDPTLTEKTPVQLGSNCFSG